VKIYFAYYQQLNIQSVRRFYEKRLTGMPVTFLCLHPLKALTIINLSKSSPNTPAFPIFAADSQKSKCNEF
jgi:hypothetical protein